MALLLQSSLLIVCGERCFNMTQIFQHDPAQTLSPLFWQVCHRRSPQPLSHRGSEYAGRRHRRGNIRSTSMSTIRKC